jgi:hypothetical protein
MVRPFSVRFPCAYAFGATAKYIDPQAEFIFVEPTADPQTLALDGHTFDMRGAEYSHEGDLCTFQVMLERHDLQGDPALVEMGRIIRDADVPPSRTRRHEAAAWMR